MTPLDDSTPDLDQWVRRLTQALQILDLTPDTQELLDLARQVSGAVAPEAGPLTTFCVGCAAALDASALSPARSAGLGDRLETDDDALRDRGVGCP